MNINVMLILQATTVAFMTAKIEERGEIAAKLAAAAAYTPFILTVIFNYFRNIK